MPKRILDGEAVAFSHKLKSVEPASFRLHYPYLLTLALANGVFECDPDLIFGKRYAYLLPEVSPQTVAEILREFERVKLLFQWREPDGKLWGYWIGIDKPGRLPNPARLKKRHESVGPWPPVERLNQFLVDGRPLADQGQADGRPMASLGSGFGSGFGSGLGTGKNIIALSSDGVEVSAKPKKEPSPDDGFEIFWKAYPRKAGKGAALKAWKNIRPSADLCTTIHRAIESQKSTKQWRKDGGQFIPYPATWLNQQRWLDESQSRPASGYPELGRLYEEKPKKGLPELIPPY